jgi:hypothetical protein
MKALSFDTPPVHGKTTHQRIDQGVGLLIGGIGQMGITGGGQDTMVAEDFLNFKQVNACFD